MMIRNETSGDLEAISLITQAAFAKHPYSHQTEQFIITSLRAAGALTLSLVVEVEGQVVGHIAFSPVTVSDGSPHWYGLGPLSVLPSHQRQGIGKALVGEGLSRLRRLGAAGCVLVGDPNYYGKFGFESIPGLLHEGVPQEYVLALSFNNSWPQGTVAFHPSFAATA